MERLENYFLVLTAIEDNLVEYLSIKEEINEVTMSLISFLSFCCCCIFLDLYRMSQKVS